jgi:hypothetical protein
MRTQMCICNPCWKNYKFYGKGFTTIDVMRPKRSQAFWLWNICMQNIHDYLTYGLLVGCQMKGYMACPLRDPMVDIRCSSHFKKNVYQGHRHYLSTHHPYQRIVSLSMDMWNMNLYQQESLQLIFQERKMNMWGMVD